MEEHGPDQSQIFQRETAHIRGMDSFYMSTVGENGWPYVQFRGGPKGFIKVIDRQTIGYADFRGNMQYISTGNIRATKKAALILLNYPTKTRLKIWAETEILDPEEHPKLRDQLVMADYKAKVERLVIFNIKSFDWNCPQHITPKYTLDELKVLMESNPDIKEYLLRAP